MKYVLFWGVVFYFALIRPAMVYEHVTISSEMPLLFQWIMEDSIRFPEVVFAQAMHETTFPEPDGRRIAFNSPIFLENNNPFGMKCAKKRRTTCIGTRRGHAYYRSVRDAVEDYKLWQQKQLAQYEAKSGDVVTIDAYIQFLEAMGYAEDPKYRDGVMHQLRKYHRVIARLKASRSLVDPI